MIVKFTFVDVFPNPWGKINNSILWTRSQLQMASSLTVFVPRKINISSWIIFSSNFFFCYFHISIPHIAYWTVIKGSYYSYFFEKKWFHPITIVIKILSLDLLLFIYFLLNQSPRRYKCTNMFLVRIKDITALGPLQRVPSWKKIQMDQKSFCHVNILLIHNYQRVRFNFSFFIAEKR